jgi:hypothetical protein
MKKLPIGIQTFKKIREDDYIYADKTKYALEIINNYQYVFLSRPRRFGKSLFLDTLHNIFEGNKELFKDLYIYDKWDWEDKYPVIKISWGGSNFKSYDQLYDKAKRVLLQNQERLDIECKDDMSYSGCFEYLIQKTYEKYQKQVVILVDEYDKPILDSIDNIPQANNHRDFLREFYSVLKENDAYIKFAFLTGISKFSKAIYSLDLIK